MTSAELAEVCKRYGIRATLDSSEIGDVWIAHMPVPHGNSGRVGAPLQPLSEVVCDRLKVRWGMTVTPCETHDGQEIIAHVIESDGTMVAEMRPTELAAVVALADRMRGEA